MTSVTRHRIDAKLVIFIVNANDDTFFFFTKSKAAQFCLRLHDFPH